MLPNQSVARIPMGVKNLPIAPDFGYEFARMLSAAKLKPRQAAQLWSVAESHINAVLGGKEIPNAELENAIQGHHPLNVADLYETSVRHLIPVHDNAAQEVVVKSRDEAAATRRAHYRQLDNNFVHVYDYCDTAVCSVSEMTIIPEAIWIHLITEKPEDLRGFAVLSNTGHFEQQLTVFVGEINYYAYDLNHEPQCFETSTGDMNYIVPFVPHLFTKRTEDEAYIVAVTFRGVLGQTDFLDCIRNMTEDEFLSKAKAKLREIENGPEMKRFHGSPGTLVTKYSESGPKSFGKYLRRVLMAGAPFQPGLISCEYTFPEELTNSDTQDTPDLKLDCEQYIYILHAPVRFIANDYNSILEPGSSLIIKKNVRHGFSPAEKGKPKIISFQMDDKDSDAWGIVALSLQFAGEKGAARIRRNSKHWSN